MIESSASKTRKGIGGFSRREEKGEEKKKERGLESFCRAMGFLIEKYPRASYEIYKQKD